MRKILFSVWGKLLGGFFGYAVAGPLGALFGIYIGNFFDKGFSLSANTNPNAIRGEVRRVFHEVTFSVMAHIAKSDGRVSEEEIEKARETMRTLRLTTNEQKEAIRAFTAGKSENFKLDLALTELKHVCREQTAILKLFVELQYRVVCSKGSPLHVNIHKQRLLNTVFERLGYAPIFRTDQSSQYQQYGYSNSQNQRQQYYSPPPFVDELALAYKTLGVSTESTASEIKNAYRKLMSQHHPDKLIARGLSEREVKQGTEQAQKIQAAYEKIRGSRGF